MSKLLKVTLAIIVPVLFLITLVFLMMQLLGLNPKDGFKGLISDIPFMASHQTTSGSVKSSSGSGTQNAVKADVKEVQQKNQALEDELSSKTDKINELQSQLSAIQKQQADEKKAEQNKQKESQQTMIQQTYKNMDPVKAGAIFDKMDNADAAYYLNMLDNQTKANILQNLPAKKAAALTPLLKAMPEKTSAETAQAAQTANEGG